MKQRTKRRTIFLIANIICAVIVIFPLFYALSLSFMNNSEIYEIKLIPRKPILTNYTNALDTIPLARFILNSLMVSSAITLLQLITGSLAGYSLSVLKYKGQKAVFFILLSTMMIPSQVIIIANYLFISKLGLSDNMVALILPYMASAFCMFNMRQAFMQLPRELKEASMVDGCSNFRFFRGIALPILLPNLAASGIYAFVTTWNQYLWPLLITNDIKKRTVQIGMGMLITEDSTNVGSVMAGAVMILIPTITVFVAGHKFIVSGLTSGSVKG